MTEIEVKEHFIKFSSGLPYHKDIALGEDLVVITIGNVPCECDSTTENQSGNGKH